jgi:hypothetical protein
MAKRLRFGRVNLLLDRNDAATPCMVSIGVGRNEATSTYWCAREVGTVGCEDEYTLTERELEWLDTKEDICAAVETEARKGNPEYS